MYLLFLFLACGDPGFANGSTRHPSVTKQIYDHGEVVQYTCPAGTASRSCGRLGLWSNNPVQCKFVLGMNFI